MKQRMKPPELNSGGFFIINIVPDAYTEEAYNADS
jgi:hypothetical protein